MRVEALVSGASDVVGPETTLGDAANVLMSRSIGALAVVDGRQVIGILTDRDVVRAVALPLGLVDNKVCAIDETWSGLRFARRKS